MENLVYWHGKAVGTESGPYLIFFSSAPPDALATLSKMGGSTVKQESPTSVDTPSELPYDCSVSARISSANTDVRKVIRRGLR